jgi:hypothetical protein
LDSSIIQGPIFCRAVPNPNFTIRNFFIAVHQVSALAGEGLWPHDDEDAAAAAPAVAVAVESRRTLRALDAVFAALEEEAAEAGAGDDASFASRAEAALRREGSAPAAGAGTHTLMRQHQLHHTVSDTTSLW